jgi:hypothetical protein
MAIQNGQLTNADEVMNAMGVLIKNMSQVLLDREIAGYNSFLDKEYLNLKIDPLIASTDVDGTTGNISYVSNEVDTTRDVWSSIQFPDAWTEVTGSAANYTGTLTTNPDHVVVQGQWSGSAGPVTTSVTHTSIDLRNSNANSSITSKIQLATGGGSSDPTSISASIQLFDGSTAVTLYNTTSTTGVTRGVFRFDINPGANTVTWYNNADINDESSSSNVDITSLSDVAAWRLRLTVTATGTGADSYQWRFRPLRYLISSSGTSNFVSTATTASSTITNAILTANTSTVGTAVYQLSANNGSNWETVTLNQIHRFTNAGTQLRIRVQMTTDPTAFYELRQYTVVYNLY